MNIEEARDILVNVIADEIIGTYCLDEAQKYNCSYCENDDCIYTKSIETVLNELDKKDKIIDMMAKYIRAGDIEEDICKDIEECIPENLQCENCIKEYFYNKVEIPEEN